MVGNLPGGCCASVTSGHATAVPPSAVMNCRLPMPIAICPVPEGIMTTVIMGNDNTPQIGGL